MQKEDDDGKWLHAHKLSLSDSTLTGHLKESSAAVVKSIDKTAADCIKRLISMKLGTEYFNIYSFPAVWNAIGLLQQKVDWALSNGPLETVKERCKNEDGLANGLRQQRDASQTRLDSLYRQSYAAKGRGEDRAGYHAHIQEERDLNHKLHQDLASAVVKNDSLQAYMQETSSTKDGSNGAGLNHGVRDVLKVAPADLMNARSAMSTLSAVSGAVSGASKQGCLTSILACAKRHSKVYDALSSAVRASSGHMFEDVLLRDESRHPSEWNGSIPKDLMEYMHTEVENGAGESLMGRFGLIGRFEFDEWLKEYNVFLDEYEENYGYYCSYLDKREYNRSVECIYKIYLSGVYNIMKAMTQREEDDLGCMIREGLVGILGAERCLRERWEIGMNKSLMDLWEKTLGGPNTADLVKKAVYNLVHYMWQTAPTPATRPAPVGLICAAGLQDAIANVMMDCSDAASVVKLLEGHISACDVVDQIQLGRAPSGYLMLCEAKTLHRRLCEFGMMPSKQWMLELVELTAKAFHRQNPRLIQTARLLYTVPELGLYADVCASSEGKALLAEVEKLPSLVWKSISFEALGLVGHCYNKKAPSWTANHGKRVEVQKLSAKKAALQKQVAKRGREETAESKAALAKLLRDTAASDPEWPHPRNLPLTDAQNVEGGEIVFQNGLYKLRKRKNEERNDDGLEDKKQKTGPTRPLCESCASLGIVTQVSAGCQMLCKPHKLRYGSLADAKHTQKQMPEEMEDVGADEANAEVSQVSEYGPSTSDVIQRIKEIDKNPSYAAATRRAAFGKRGKEFQPEVYMAYRLCLIHAAAVSSTLPSSLLGLLINRLEPLELQIPGRFFTKPLETDAIGRELARDHMKTLPSWLGKEQVVCIDEHLYRRVMELPPPLSLQSSDWDTAVALHPSGGVKNGVPYVMVGARLGNIPNFSLSISPNGAKTFTPVSYRVTIVTFDGEALKRPFNDDAIASDIYLHPYGPRCCCNAIEGVTGDGGTVLDLKLSHYVTTLGTRLRFKVELGGGKVALNLNLKSYDLWYGSRSRYFEHADVQLRRAQRVLYSPEFEVGTPTRCVCDS